MYLQPSEYGVVIYRSKGGNFWSRRIIVEDRDKPRCQRDLTIKLISLPVYSRGFSVLPLVNPPVSTLSIQLTMALTILPIILFYRSIDYLTKYIWVIKSETENFKQFTFLSFFFFLLFSFYNKIIFLSI